LLISQLSGVISITYHPIVFAGKGNTPPRAIYYEHKTKRFIQKTGLDDFALHVQTLSAPEVIKRFANLERKYDTVRERLRAATPSLQKESRRRTAILVAKLKEYGWTIGEP
jgi:polysaccharide pyruvyl transferase WcaK-like protein